jgi:hypothetical protein
MEPEKKQDNKKIIAIVLVVLLVAFGGFLIFRNFSSNSSSTSTAEKNTTAISGNLNINGVVPAGAVLSLVSSEVDSSNTPTEFDSVTDPKDGDEWSFTSAKSGKTYIIEGVLKSSNGVELTKTNKITITAPATGETLTINLEDKTLTGVAVISGLVKVNGFIPTGATVSLAARTPNTQFEVTREDMPAKAETFLTYDKAVAGQKYDIVGYLYDSTGKRIGESEILSLVAPAKNEVLNINSNASAPAPSAAPSTTPKPNSSITGKIDLNGAVPSNSRVVILQAPMNSNDFVVAVDNVPAVDGQGWVWSGAINGTWYNMQAVLKQRQDNGTDKDIALSQQTTVAAPAINVMFTINTGIAPSVTPIPTQ